MEVNLLVTINCNLPPGPKTGLTSSTSTRGDWEEAYEQDELYLPSMEQSFPPSQAVLA